ncbi:glycosyltransferase family 2 protein [Algibacter aquimarinus]|uniref:Glycosyltransferase 2-like domain-containing protein n=1 Tax=Algibacter aquimarinus TaxID=1136748 RepID=A0ABP9HQ48_9FLAO
MVKKTAVIIVTYNGMQWIEKCISSVLNSSVACDIIVVDNNSTDSTISFIKENFKKVVLLKQVKNLGFGAANNIGMSYAIKSKVDYVFLLNQDAYVFNDTIQKSVEIHCSNSEFGVISPIHLNGDGSKLDKNFSSYIKVNDTLFYDALKGSFSKTIYEVPFVNAAAWLIPRKTLETVGGFDPIFHHYAEDDNYCQRVIFHEFKIGIVPNTCVKHDREFRKIETKLTRADEIILKERKLKYKWGNINDEVREEIENQKKYLSKLIIKLFIKLKFKKAKYYKNQLALIERIMPEIFKSRDINSKKGKHYL